ncbi:MAG: hypothetical protein QOD87_1284, partial [Pseudonocardiales bacterium]|nr:hypothetical protein [Pseudonocardiales bacterium]
LTEGGVVGRIRRSTHQRPHLFGLFGREGGHQHWITGHIGVGHG